MLNKWPVGLMDKASASGAGDSRFESWAGHALSKANADVKATAATCSFDYQIVAGTNSLRFNACVANDVAEANACFLSSPGCATHQNGIHGASLYC